MADGHDGALARPQTTFMYISTAPELEEYSHGRPGTV